MSFSDAIEGAKALREMNGKYVGNRPCKLSKSTWDVRAPAIPCYTHRNSMACLALLTTFAFQLLGIQSHSGCENCLLLASNVTQVIV